MDEVNSNQLMIAHFNWDIHLPEKSLDAICVFQKSVCNGLQIFGKITINEEGLSGYLSATESNLLIYETIVRQYMLTSYDVVETAGSAASSSSLPSCSPSITKDEEQGGSEAVDIPSLEMRYCELRDDIPVQKQVFTSLSVACRPTSTSTSSTCSKKNSEGGASDGILNKDSILSTENKSSDNKNDKSYDEGGGDVSLILAAERTLFAAVNNAWLLAVGGIGLMSVGNGDERATNTGIVILSGSATCTLVAYVMHVKRIRLIKSGKPFTYSSTIVWSSLIVAMALIALILELYFGVLHPYLDREKAVTIANADGINAVSEIDILKFMGKRKTF